MQSEAKLFSGSFFQNFQRQKFLIGLAISGEWAPSVVLVVSGLQV
jgi:hypothetical protein